MKGSFCATYGSIIDVLFFILGRTKFFLYFLRINPSRSPSVARTSRRILSGADLYGLLFL
jgi:hypothetical protein